MSSRATCNTVIKILLSSRTDERLLRNSSAIIATVRDPRGIIVSWLPCKAVANPQIARNTDLIDEVTDAFDRKTQGEAKFGVTYVEQIYERHPIAMLAPHDYAEAYDQLAVICRMDKCYVDRFRSSPPFGEVPTHCRKNCAFL